MPKARWCSFVTKVKRKPAGEAWVEVKTQSHNSRALTMVINSLSGASRTSPPLPGPRATSVVSAPAAKPD